MHEWQSHTGEAQLRIQAGSEEDVFAEAARAFGRLVELDRAGEPAIRRVSVEAPDRGSLLVELLGELIFLAETEGFVPDRALVSLDVARLDAQLDGRLTRVDPLVKAATYHGLAFERHDDIWEARVVLDV
jgi:SHS2 domain-containing protein